MKLLVITQKVDSNDSNLGFFHIWLEKISERVDQLYVVCLQEGESHLPNNVTVLSLGKETGASRLEYLWRFYKYIWSLRKSYDGVFVHMNPEYVILGGLLWKIWNKKVLLWYTHKSVNLKLRLAEKFVSKIFTASKESFRLPSKKVEVVGHGIDVERFSKDNVKPVHNNDLFLSSAGRITSSKDWETVMSGLAELSKVKDMPPAVLDIAGMPVVESDFVYVKKLYSLFSLFAFNSYTQDQMPLFYQRHHIFIHTSRTGSLDKVVLEALAAGRIVVTSSEAYASLADDELKGVVFRFPSGDYKELAKIIEEIYHSGILKSIPNQRAVEYVRRHHNLVALIDRIVVYFEED